MDLKGYIAESAEPSGKSRIKITHSLPRESGTGHIHRLSSFTPFRDEALV